MGIYVALGGALDGVFVNFIAPLLFDGFWELHGSLVFVCLFAILMVALDYKTLNLLQRSIVVTIGCVVVSTLIWFLEMHISEQQDKSIFNKRSFFGVLHIYEKYRETYNHLRSLYHGRINHGQQLLKNSEQQTTMYFTPKSGVGLALNRFISRTNKESKHDNLRRGRSKYYRDTKNKPIKVGAIGMGIGSIAAYAKSGDIFRFYEINSQVESAAKKYFNYLENSKAKIEV